MTRQLSFNWPQREALGEEDFFVTSANALAHEMVMASGSWPEGRLALVGPPGSGKTHLARLFQQAHGAEIVEAAAIMPTRGLPEAECLVIEAMDRLPSEAEEWVFHAHNHLVGPGRQGRLLLTSRTPPSRWSIRLPDLASRLSAAHVVRIEEPDDTLLAAVLMKQFQDRQLSPSPAAIETLLRHMDRSFEAARRLVARLDTTALAQGRAITRDLVRDVLDKPGPEAQ